MEETLIPRLPGTGTLALVGSGEYLPPIETLDRWLLARLNAPAHVVCLPTGAGSEGDARIQYWCDLGVAHFQKLGVAAVEALRVIDHASAMDDDLARQVNAANFVYFSGGKPAYLHTALHDTPVFRAVLAVLARGGVVAGCSAGAMIFGERIPTSLFTSNWQPGFGLLPGAFIIPHFDEIPHAMLTGMRLLAGSLTVVGIDGSTALVCTSSGCTVQGNGSVTLLRHNHEERFSAGQTVK